MDSVQSILDQTYTNWKMIMLTDDTHWMVGNYRLLDDRITVVQSDKPQSAEQMINYAAANLVKTKWIALQYADCISLPKRLELSLKWARESNADIVTTDCIDFHPNKRKYVERMAMFQDPAIDFATSPTMFMKNEVMIANPYRVFVKLWSDIHWCEDLWRNHKRYKHEKLPLPLVYRFDRDKTWEYRQI